MDIKPETLEIELKKLLDDPKEIINKSKYAREWVEKHHSLEAVGDKMYCYYKEYGVAKL